MSSAAGPAVLARTARGGTHLVIGEVDSHAIHSLVLQLHDLQKVGGSEDLEVGWEREKKEKRCTCTVSLKMSPLVPNSAIFSACAAPLLSAAAAITVAAAWPIRVHRPWRSLLADTVASLKAPSGCERWAWAIARVHSPARWALAGQQRPGCCGHLGGTVSRWALAGLSTAGLLRAGLACMPCETCLSVGPCKHSINTATATQ